MWPHGVESTLVNIVTKRSVFLHAEMTQEGSLVLVFLQKQTWLLQTKAHLRCIGKQGYIFWWSQSSLLWRKKTHSGLYVALGQKMKKLICDVINNRCIQKTLYPLKVCVYFRKTALCLCGVLVWVVLLKPILVLMKDVFCAIRRRMRQEL